MDIRDKSETGWPSGGNLVQRVAAYVRDDRLKRYSGLEKLTAAFRQRELRGFRVGITNNPTRRAASYGGEYSEMVLLYRTDSLKNAREWEEELITYFTSAQTDRLDNLYIGGGRSAEAGPFHVYVVVRRPD